MKLPAINLKDSLITSTKKQSCKFQIKKTGGYKFSYFFNPQPKKVFGGYPPDEKINNYNNKFFDLLPEHLNSGKSIAVITGATSGIGKEFASKFARLGYNLIITGRRKAVISRVANRLKDLYHIEVEVSIIDFSIKKDLNKFLKILETKRNIEVLVNNAGYGLSERFSEDDVNHQLKMLNVHIVAPLKIIHKVLPHMIELNKGIIINVTSLAAYTPTPDNAMYTSTKSFLTNFTESLSMQLNNTDIKVQCLCPGYTNTDFHNKPELTQKSVHLGIKNWMNPSEVVDYSLDCLEKDKVICIPGISNKLFLYIISVVPRRIYYFISGLFNNSTEESQGKRLYA